MAFSHEEQEEIINEFLSKNDNNNNSEEENVYTLYNRLNIEAGSHGRELKQIQTKTYIPIKYAMFKIL